MSAMPLLPLECATQGNPLFPMHIGIKGGVKKYVQQFRRN